MIRLASPWKTPSTARPFEMHFGAAQCQQTFAFLQVGAQVGLRFITEGRFYRGAGGATGEIGRMPFPWSGSESTSREGLEYNFGSRVLIERCRVDWPVGEGAPQTRPRICSRML
ncbi:hypothetical protein OHD62_06100 [Mesorhizobium sp. YC-39]|uniref:hypothetical protein n=1 Tax=unclassified Mesorhizobium TaxID=325217 RepID=UPI0021E83310|nr:MULTISPECIES: hypothetical protein [unclassified Mesorhizobium]MCV3205662.1 hypothetical protein [Mesorhizobium sp. YC-2]MCV3227939.1 hypothetical protein [Mesorhizobium sp. YC-39]